MTMIKIKVLGSGNAFSAGGRFNTCFYVHAGDYVFLLDCGASSQVALQKEGINASSIDAIMLTHLHGDHMGGVPFVELAGKMGTNQKKKLKIVGPSGTKAVIHALTRLLFPEADKSHGEYIEYATGETRIEDNVLVSAFPAIHVPQTNPHSLRIKIDGKVIAFSGDTEWNENLIAVSHHADLFICECTSLQDSHRHMSYADLAKNKSRITAKRILLTHMDESMLSLNECAFERISDGMEIIL
jgi:ribonuclease BN (tRNA processing enzyme)